MTAQRTIPTRAWFEMGLLALIWGASFMSFSIVLREIGVFTTVAFRIAGGAIVLWAYILLRGMKLPREPRIWGVFVVLGLINSAIPFTLIAWAQLSISSGLASILNASTAVLGVLVAAIFFADERLTKRKTIGVLLGFFGVSVAIGLSALKNFNLTSLAQMAILVSSLFYALGPAFARRFLKGVPPQVVAAGMTGAATLFVVPIALWVDGIPTFHYTAAAWAAIVHLSVIATALAFLMFYRVLAMAGSGNTTLITLLVAPVAIVLGALVLGEELPLRAFIGFALLAAGLLVLDGRILKRRSSRI
ncbi:MAG: DMT family transporter [Marinosulfonomonas sp.]|nr:DMT family transporter [Marinosulfonomonas sp.]